mmetsp:Transcript_25807/g.43523  ORF Transcript_25807/g.43523 Transcript_25807/m.43523 type:complete len:236 (-) Transcript_25807:3414-4121(-)
MLRHSLGHEGATLMPKLEHVEKPQRCSLYSFPQSITRFESSFAIACQSQPKVRQSMEPPQLMNHAGSKEGSLCSHQSPQHVHMAWLTFEEAYYLLEPLLLGQTYAKPSVALVNKWKKRSRHRPFCRPIVLSDRYYYKCRENNSKKHHHFHHFDHYSLQHNHFRHFYHSYWQIAQEGIPHGLHYMLLQTRYPFPNINSMVMCMVDTQLDMSPNMITKFCQAQERQRKASTWMTVYD